MAFKRGPDERRGKGGKREGAGRPNREETEFNAKLKKAVERELDTMALKIAKRYVARGLGKNGDRVLMHIIDKILPDAKQEVDLNLDAPDAFYQAIQASRRAK